MPSLEECLESAASTLAEAGRMYRRGIPPKDFQHHARVAAFEAFIEAGGDVENPTATDWCSLLPRATALLQDTIRGKGTPEWDERLRGKHRREISVNDQKSWDIWSEPVQWRDLKFHSEGSYEDYHYESITASESRAGKGNDAPFAEHAQLSSLWDRLATTLNPNELRWLYQRDALGVPQQVQIDELCALEKRYNTPDGRRRAETRINTAVSRARRKARDFLGAEWQDFAKELACR